MTDRSAGSCDQSRPSSLRTRTMSLSKQPRSYSCIRCRHHGIVVPHRGHTKVCPFTDCECWKCLLITQRSRLTALHRSLTRTRAGTGTRAGTRTGTDTETVPHVGRDEGAGVSGDMSGERPEPSPNAPVFPLPVLQCPFMVPAHFPGGYVPCPNLPPNLPWHQLVPAALYSDVLCGPFMIPHLHPAVVAPPPSSPQALEPPADLSIKRQPPPPEP